MTLRVEQFSLEPGHPWMEPTISWIESEIEAGVTAVPASEILDNYVAPNLAYYGLAESGLVTPDSLIAVGSLCGPFPMPQEMTLDNLVTRPGMQGQGYGSFLLSALERISFMQGAPRLWLSAREVPYVKAFYRNRGYVETPDPYGFNETKMVKDLHA